MQTVEGFTRQGGGPFGNDRKIIDAVFSEVVLEERQNSPPVELGDDSVVVLRVTDHKPSQQQPLEAVRAQIETRLRTGGGAEGRCRRRPQAMAQARQRGRILCARPRPRRVASRRLPECRNAPGAQSVRRPRRSRRRMLKPVFRAPRPAGAGKASAGTVTLASGDPAVFVVSAVRAGIAASSRWRRVRDAARQAVATARAAAAEFGAYMREMRADGEDQAQRQVFAQ